MRNSNISNKYFHKIQIVQYGVSDSLFIIMCKCNEKKIMVCSVTDSLLNKYIVND